MKIYILSEIKLENIIVEAVVLSTDDIYIYTDKGNYLKSEKDIKWFASWDEAYEKFGDHI